MSQPLNSPYSSLISSYEKAIEYDPDNREIYWQLSIAYLLNGQEDDAQMVWMSVLSEAGSELSIWENEISDLVDGRSIRSKRFQLSMDKMDKNNNRSSKIIINVHLCYSYVTYLLNLCF